MLASAYRSTLLLECRSIQTLSGLGGCGCFASNSSCDRIFTALQDAVDSVGVVDRCSGPPVDRSCCVFNPLHSLTKILKIELMSGKCGVSVS
ncbi:hypothetical protein F2Q69_00030296 [Brassica cretica]|uniref:Uncharacterized protein n=1 Tax=Brassica cretica TaxID=69181 RepID=A0A8S9RVZ1_BRACR|nr:hypothetical protein F2Q69_00030296 [Brassica cretica]